jgi:hypothetical protein
LSAHEFLDADRRFIAGVGRLTRWRSFAGEVLEFQNASQNRRFLRRSLLFRVSVDRMRVLFSEVMDDGKPTCTATQGSEIVDPALWFEPRLPRAGSSLQEYT